MANFSFYIQIENKNPYQITAREYYYVYASQTDSPALGIVEEYDLIEGLASELENYYNGEIATYSGIYPGYRGPGGGGLSGEDFKKNVGDFTWYNPNPYLYTINMNFDLDKINQFTGSVDKIASDVKKIIEFAFTHATASQNKIYLDPVFSYYTGRRAALNQELPNGQKNNRYTPFGATFSIPYNIKYSKVREKNENGTYNIKYQIDEIISIDNFKSQYPTLYEQSYQLNAVNTQQNTGTSPSVSPTSGLTPSGLTPSGLTPSGITPSTVTLGLSGGSYSTGLSGSTPSVPPEPPIKGTFVFNVEKPGILSHTGLGELTITEKQLGAEDFFIFSDDISYEEQELDEEYSEGAFTGSEEDIAFDIAEGQRLSQGQELLTNLDTDNPANASATDGNNGNPDQTNESSINTVARGKIKKMLEVAKGELGYKEKSTSKYPKTPGKDTKYGVYWGLNGHHYCGMFVCWCAEHAGMKVTTRGSNILSGKEKDGNMPNSIACPSGVKIFKGKNCFVSNGSNKSERLNSTVKPEPGDIVFFSWDYNQNADHVGIVVEDMGNGTVKCYEGNTSPGKEGANQSGSGVWERIRSKATILGYGKTALYDPTNLEEFTTKAGRAAKLA